MRHEYRIVFGFGVGVVLGLIIVLIMWLIDGRLGLPVPTNPLTEALPAERFVDVPLHLVTNDRSDQTVYRISDGWYLLQVSADGGRIVAARYDKTGKLLSVDCGDDQPKCP